ncbi:MAG: hypothetical protein HMLKMBBP_01931 [Planctomycetes bacterium]|nr:hypothetical protein [Planctomycetota bacterium]
MRHPLAVFVLTAVTVAAGAARAEDDATPSPPPPPPPLPPSAPPEALVELGRRLFHDPAASRDGKESCSSCHDAKHGWSDPRPRSIASDGTVLRHSQPVTDLSAGDRGAGFHRDGEFATVRELILHRVGRTRDALVAAARREFARPELPDRPKGARRDDAAAARVSASYGSFSRDELDFPVPVDLRVGSDERYAPGFHAAFGSPDVTSDRIVDALEAFTLSLRTGRNRVDRHLAGDRDALGDAELRGLEVFRGEGQCVSCHPLDLDADGRAVLTDGRFHASGVAVIGGGLDRGRAAATRLWGDRFLMKTPSLRDVASRRSWMHDGSLGSLEAVVEYYASASKIGGDSDPALAGVRIPRERSSDLVAFLRALSAPQSAGELPSRAPLSKTIRLLRPDGKPAAFRTVRIEPAGQLFGSALRHRSEQVIADIEGRITFPFPDASHVRLSARGATVGRGALLPDNAPQMDLLVAPDSLTLLVLEGPDLPELMTAEVVRGPHVKQVDDLVRAARADRGPAPSAASPVSDADPRGAGPHEATVIDDPRAMLGLPGLWRLPVREPSMAGCVFGCGEPPIEVPIRLVGRTGAWRSVYQVTKLPAEAAGPRLIVLRTRTVDGHERSFEFAADLGRGAPVVSRLHAVGSLAEREGLATITASEVASAR